MAIFRRRPIVVDAVRYQPGELPACASLRDDNEPFVDTGAGPVRLWAGDWVVTRPDGTHTVLHHDEFAETFEPVLPSPEDVEAFWRDLGRPAEVRHP